MEIKTLYILLSIGYILLLISLILIYFTVDNALMTCMGEGVPTKINNVAAKSWITFMISLILGGVGFSLALTADNMLIRKIFGPSRRNREEKF